MKIFFLIIASVFVNSFAIAQQEDNAWQETQLNEIFMKKISKEQCMNKTLSSMKDGCNSDSCVKTIAGVLGDCLTWARGNQVSYCVNYDLNYTKQCIDNKLDGRACFFVNFMKEQYCKNTLSELEIKSKNKSPLELYKSQNLLGVWSIDCSKRINHTVLTAVDDKLISESYADNKLIGRALYANVKIISKDKLTYTSYVYNKNDELVRIVSGITSFTRNNTQQQNYLEVKPVGLQSATILIDNNIEVATGKPAKPISKCDL